MATTADIMKQLPGLEYNGVNYLYNLEPRASNLFYAGNIITTGETASPTARNTLPNTCFRLNKITFALPKLDFDPPTPQRPYPVLKAIQHSTAVSITWVEDIYRSVERYHINWLRSWYARSTDSLVIGSAGKVRQIDIYPFHYLSTSDEKSPYIASAPEILYEIQVRGLMLTDLDSVSFDMADNGSPLYTVKYQMVRVGITAQKVDTSTLWSPSSTSQLGEITESSHLGTIMEGTDIWL